MADKLYSEEYLDALNPEKSEQSGPATVFGLTFKNDEERRQYFREELRKKLPELRNIEGFPIGEDDDIINLSDPPYYTACPNPWLNDFIRVWENEKKQLKIDGKRVAEKIVKHPYASDVSEGKNNPIYMAHAYHTKVPHPAIMRYILHYTEPGDIVLDGFCGTGMTGVAANLCGSPTEVSSLHEKNVKVGARHAICSDLSPIATLISAQYNLKFNPNSFRKKANSVLDKVEEELGWLFRVNEGNHEGNMNFTVWSDVLTCPNCSHEIEFWKEAVSLENNDISKSITCPNCGTVSEKRNMPKSFETYYDKVLSQIQKRNKKVPVLINFKVNKKKIERYVSEQDIKTINRANEVDLSCRITELQDGYNTGQPKRSNGINYVHQFYTERVLAYLSRVYELVKGDAILTAWFTSVSLVASKLYSFRLNRKNGIMKGTLYVPSLTTECNPYNLLKGKIEDFVKAHYQERENSVTTQSSATNLDLLDSDSIDYIFVDPPFGANIMYSEVSSIWEGWIGVQTDNQKEAIVNNFQNKGLFEYQQLMNQSLKEFYRVLKPGKWLTMEFSNTSASVWNSIQNALQGVGFIIANVAALDKKQGSIKAITTTTAVKEDLVITCYKPTNALTSKFEESFNTLVNVWDFIDDYLMHLPVHLQKDNATTSVVERSPKILFDRLISYYVQHGYPIPMDAQTFQAGLREHYIERDGMFFTVTQAAEYEEKKLKAPDFVPMGIIISDEANGIEWLKNELRDNPQTYQDLQPKWMKALNGVRKGDKLPGLDEILVENFIQNDNGTWRMANINDDVDLEKLRTKALLKEFKLYLEVASKPRGKLKDVRVEAVRAGFKQCYSDKNFADIVLVGDRIPQNLLTEDEVLLQYYDIASSRV